MAQDFKKTLNLPKTKFPMRANLAKREPDFLSFWENEDIYNKLREKNTNNETFILHDGPPYANGNIHIGTAFNKILKDFIPKYKWMRGYYAPYVPGWDTHGLPIELRVLREKGITKEEIPGATLRSQCQAYAEKYIDVQREEFKRLGVLGEWGNPYLTFRPEYEATQLEAFSDMAEKELIYKGLKSVYWCTDCQTALAAAEIEYEDESSTSIYVAYPLLDISDRFPSLAGKEVSVLIWTTTTWTLPASQAVAIHPALTYGFFPTEDGHIYLFAKELQGKMERISGLEFGQPLLTVKGKELELAMTRHPFYDDRELPIVLADYVQLDQGTGCVHTAPGHGVEDFETGMRYNLVVANPVDSKGVFLPDTPLVGGKDLSDGAEVILDELRTRNRLLGTERIVHSYPHCWRCKQPVIFRATEQWFVSVAQFRKQALQQIDNVQWVPHWGQDRIMNMVRDRSDWCISRQRVWGVPIPAFYCSDCGGLVLTPDRIRRVADRVRKEGSNIWWELSPRDLLGDLASCPACGSTKLRKDTDIMDVWFDSGVSHLSVLENWPDLSWPADMYLEGSDQHRGWFQTSLLTSVAIRGRAPYRSVLTHGFIVDGEGRKMSKSLGNVIAPQEIIQKYGADILRLWVASTDYRNDVRISDSIVKNLVESYRRIRNTARFMLGNLRGFSPSDILPYKELTEIDQWILSKLQRVISKSTQSFDRYEFHVPTFIIHQFCVNEISSLLLDTGKDRLYCEHPSNTRRRSAQTVMWYLLDALTRMLAPVLSFTAEEIWQYLRKIDPTMQESVLLADWPTIWEQADDRALEEEWETLLSYRGAVSRALEQARSREIIGHPLESRITIDGDGKTMTSMQRREPSFWEELCIVSQMAFAPPAASMERFEDEQTGLIIGIGPAKGEKCPRCWRFTEQASADGLCPRCAEVMERLSSEERLD